jgi:hypothetical protein
MSIKIKIQKSTKLFIMRQSKLFESILREATYKQLISRIITNINDTVILPQNKDTSKATFSQNLVALLKQALGYAANLGNQVLTDDGTLSFFFKKASNPVNAALAAAASRCKYTTSFIRFLNVYGSKISTSFNINEINKILSEANESNDSVSNIQAKQTGRKY